MGIDIENLRTWVGRTETTTDLVTAAPLRALAATLDRDDPAPSAGDEIPTCWHWLYFLPLHRQSQLGPDGHAKRGDFLPPVPLSRRMWAGSRLEFPRPLRVGQEVSRISRIVDVSGKDGRSGPLVFVRVRHEISAQGEVSLIEEQDLVYREPPRSGETGGLAKPAPDNPDWEREVCVDDVMMFRYSALTFNGFRIHYDRPYATEVQGYPGLVVHAPLVATLLLDLVRRQMPHVAVARFQFRALAPLFDVDPFFVCGRAAGGSVELWARGPGGALAMEANATLG